MRRSVFATYFMTNKSNSTVLLYKDTTIFAHRTKIAMTSLWNPLHRMCGRRSLSEAEMRTGWIVLIDNRQWRIDNEPSWKFPSWGVADAVWRGGLCISIIMTSLRDLMFLFNAIFLLTFHPFGIPWRNEFQKFPSVGGVSEGLGGFSFLGGRRSLTGWIYPKTAPRFFRLPRRGIGMG